MLGNVSATATVVLVGSSAGGIGAFNAATWLLESFDQVCLLALQASVERLLINGGCHISIQRIFNNKRSDAHLAR